MKCKQCNNNVTGKKQFCNDACRMAFKRKANNPNTQPEQIRPQPEQKSKPNKQTEQKTGNLTPQLMAGLAGGVAVPTNQPNAATATMTARQINNKVSIYPGIEWKHSPEYAELIYRLLTWSKQKLREQGHAVPAWKDTL